MDNMRIWGVVEKTDPKYTKQFSRGGGFKGTATNATYLARKATEVFGPCGTGWGINVVSEEVFVGAPHIIEGQVVAHDAIHKVHARLWYIVDGKRGEVEQFGQTQIVGRNKNGFYTDEEAPKKSLTDAMSKCLSLLGFSADIHLGLYDDNKYVAELRREFAGKPEATDKPSAKVTPLDGAWDAMDDESKEFLEKVAAYIRDQFEGEKPTDEESDRAHAYLAEQQLTTDEKAALWTRLPSHIRSALKRAHERANKEAA